MSLLRVDRSVCLVSPKTEQPVRCLWAPSSVISNVLHTNRSRLQYANFIFVPDHVGITSSDKADSLASSIFVVYGRLMDRADVWNVMDTLRNELSLPNYEKFCPESQG